MALVFQPVTLARVGDAVGVLVMDNGRLLAVISQLDADHGVIAGRWFIEMRMDQLVVSIHETFEDLPQVEAWFASAAS